MAEIVAIPQDGQLVDAKVVIDPIRKEIRDARAAQRAFHPTWASNLAFASGQQWLVWHEKSRTLRTIQQMDPRYRNRELYTADIITENRLAILGEMGSDDDRPELLLRRDDQSAEDFQAAANRAMGYGWDHEWHGDERLAEIDRLTLDLGTAAMRCHFDPSQGPTAYKDVPHENGQPILNSNEAMAKVAAAVTGEGPALTFADVPSGRICWKPYAAYGILAQAGVAHEKDFTFDCLVEPVKVADLKEMYGELAGDLREDGDIGSTIGEATVGAPGSGADRMKNRLRGYVWFFRYYKRPTRKYPKGRCFYFAGNDLKLMEVKEELPYVEPDGTYCAGIAYFHWWRVTGRFFSRSLVEALKDGQRAKNKRRTQSNEIIDRGMPKYFAQANSTAQAQTNQVMERIDLQPGEGAPVIFPGFGPGDWMYREDEQIDKDVRKSTGITEPTLGENPASVTNYSQLATLREQSQVKRQVVYVERKLSIAKLCEFSMYDIRTYWGEKKEIMLAGDDNRMEAEVFNATRIPPYFILRTPKGAAKPRSQSGELQKIQDIWNATVATLVFQRDPDAWILWYKSSLEHGQALDLPDSPADDQAQKAEFENHLMLAGHEPVPLYWEPPEVHIPRHRSAQTQAAAVGDTATYDRIERHVQATLLRAQENAAALQGGGAPGQPPGEPQGIPQNGAAAQGSSPSPQPAAPAPQ